jgi:hypothetical protein
MDRTFAGAMRTAIAACLALVAAVALQPAPAAALPPPYDPFDFNEAVVQQSGPEVMVFDWTTQKCENDDIPDEAARAFRDNTGKINLMDTHFWNYRFTADSLTGTFAHPCARTMSSTNSASQTSFDNKEWLASPWTADGQTVYALIHNEYQGGNFLANCGAGYQCWWNSITSAVSTDGGATFSNTGPGHMVATIPWQFTKDGPMGYFTPSNIVRSGDGWFYAMFRAEDYPNQDPPAGFPVTGPAVQRIGTCLMRTRDLSNPQSWRAWNGTSFSVRFINPYLETTGINPADHVCAPVDLQSIGTVTENLFYSTYFKKWVLVGNSVGDGNFPDKPPGVYYALSDDLVNWSDLKLLMAAEITWARNCVLPDPIKEVSILDPDSTSRNFTTVGQTAQLFYTWYHMSGCNGTLDRDLLRVPITFTDPTP